MEDSKKKSGKKRQPITIEMKKEIIKKYEEGVTLTVFVVCFCIYISLKAIFSDFWAFFFFFFFVFWGFLLFCLTIMVGSGKGS